MNMRVTTACIALALAFCAITLSARTPPEWVRAESQLERERGREPWALTMAASAERARDRRARAREASPAYRGVRVVVVR